MEHRMTQPRLVRALTALLGIVWLASCGKLEPPPGPKVEPPQATTPAPVIDVALQQLAAEVYVFAYPLVLTDVTRAVDTASVASGTFRHESTLPDASSTNVTNPNADFLYSQAWLDLSQGPVILSTPDTHGRYYLVAMLGAWTNVVASLGKRTTGTAREKFALVGPRWKGKLPGGVFEVRSPTELAWLYARTQTSGGSDLEAATKVQDEFTLAPLRTRRKPAAKDAPAGPSDAGAVDTKTAPRLQVAQMDAGSFFTRFAMLLDGNRPTKDDAPMLEKMKKLGIEAGHPFDTGGLDPVAARSIEAGAKAALDAITSAGGRGLGGDIRNGWTVDTSVGRWGTDYGKRAVAAYVGLGINAPEDAVFMATHLDASGHRLDGSNRYVLHFDKGNAPPASGFWSLSLYDDAQHFVANALNRYNIGSEGQLQTNADGSLDIYLQAASPGPEREANWLPAPPGPFNLILRIYWPKRDVVNGKWIAPGIVKAA
jgi:hypothetical protein